MKTLIHFVALIIFSVIASGSGLAPAGSVRVFVRGEGGYYCHKIPYLLRTQSNTLIALAEGRGKNGRSACDDYAGTDLVYKRSIDGGASWSELQVVYSNSSTTESNVIGNAAPVQDRHTGRIWMPFCRNNEEMFMTYSDDDGASWAEPQYMPHLVRDDWKWVGVGPPGGIQLRDDDTVPYGGRLLIPGYHTTLMKGNGLSSYGHIVYSDDGGATWQLGSEKFGDPYLSNECQAVQLRNGSVLINARTLLPRRVQSMSHDGGLTFDHPVLAEGLTEPLEGCEGSLIRSSLDSSTSDINEKEEPAVLYFSDPNNPSLVRQNMTIFQSTDEGQSWQVLKVVDEGAVAYSSLQIIPTSDGDGKEGGLEILYERSDSYNMVFEPDEILYWRVL